VTESRERGPDPGDRTLLEWAASERRILVTMDKDFGQIVFVDKVSHCGLVRLPDVPATKRIALVQKLLQDHAHELADGAILTVRGDRVRIARVR